MIIAITVNLLMLAIGIKHDVLPVFTFFMAGKYPLTMHLMGLSFFAWSFVK